MMFFDHAPRRNIPASGSPLFKIRERESTRKRTACQAMQAPGDVRGFASAGLITRRDRRARTIIAGSRGRGRVSIQSVLPAIFPQRPDAMQQSEPSDCWSSTASRGQAASISCILWKLVVPARSRSSRKQRHGRVGPGAVGTAPRKQHFGVRVEAERAKFIDRSHWPKWVPFRKHFATFSARIHDFGPATGSRLRRLRRRVEAPKPMGEAI